MSKIDELIKKLCPNGVKYEPLVNLCGTITTGRLNANEMVENGEYPFFTCDSNPFRIDKYAFDEEAILISGNGSQVGHINYYKGKFNAYQRTYVLYNFKQIEVKFLLHYLSGYLRNYIMIHSKKGSVPYITLPMLQNFSVPVPPLEVQCEIVHILDDFTLLSAELSAELKAREKQYKEYINILLSEKNIHNFKKRKLKDLFDFRNGLSKGKEFFGSGTPFVRYTDVYNKRFLHIEDIKERVNCTDKELETLKVKRGDVFFTRTSEIAEEVGYSSVMLDNIENCVFNGFTIKATPKTDLLIPEYCAFCFSTNEFRQYVSTRCAFTTRASLTGKTIGEFELCVPSIQEQEKIVKQLMSLYKLVNDISEGLPAEIEARQKQYEYYRDKLLTFKEFGNE